MTGFCSPTVILQGFSMHERERETERYLRSGTLGSRWLFLLVDLYKTKALGEVAPQTSEVCEEKQLKMKENK